VAVFPCWPIPCLRNAAYVHGTGLVLPVRLVAALVPALPAAARRPGTRDHQPETNPETGLETGPVTANRRVT
jgi:hypothetical protein